jgi:adenylate cyclase class IV
MQAILQDLGLSATESMKKHRVSYQLDDVHFDFDQYLDEYAFIPEFMEIEAKNASTIRQYAKKLGFDFDQYLDEYAFIPEFME